MKFKKSLALICLLALSVSTMIGCDNRSQIEKDADSAAKTIEKKMQ